MKQLSLFLAFTICCTLLKTQSFDQAEQMLNAGVAAEKFAGVSAGIAVGDEIVWTYSTGHCDENRELACAENTLFRTASIAKTITAIAALQLYEKNLLDLDVPIQKYLPDYPVAVAGKITTRQLLHQTTGMTGYASAKETETQQHYPELADAVRVFQDRPLAFEPGTKYQYTTYGYVLIGRLIEAASGQNYGDYVRDNIFTPAGMTQTDIEKFAVEYPNKSAFFSRTKRGKIKNATPNNLSNRIPGGGFHTTPADLLRLGQALLNNTLLQASSFALMQTYPDVERGQNNPYGMGFFLYGDNPTYGPVIGHTGEQTGAAGQLMILPERKAVIVVLSNTSHALRDVFQLAVDLFAFTE